MTKTVKFRASDEYQELIKKLQKKLRNVPVAEVIRRGLDALAISLGLLLLISCGGGSFAPPVQTQSITADQVFSNKAETWTFKNGYSDLTWIDVMPVDATHTVWHYTKNADRAYWTPFAAKAELYFFLEKDAQGFWYSTGGHVIFPFGSIFDSHTGQDFFYTAQQNTGMPRPYLIIGDSGFSVQTVFTEFGISDMRWQTNMYVENGFLVSEQWEGPCVHEKWWFKPGVGLWKVAPLDEGNCQPLDPMLTMERVH